ncbi:Nose resistant to fluoxetine protein 6 [Papilio machaon]|uniref:Nose resistant to fluoxetine protein 6 n=1 Tax=Papilio machaon TaxID=76193 RepID=A0A0N0PEP8_PAPMA|nr:Nose resistant to fluoxetine protein 6 [Papilio machaon]
MGQLPETTGGKTGCSELTANYYRPQLTPFKEDHITFLYIDSSSFVTDYMFLVLDHYDYGMEDASGRYTSMFYWGNNYWTGSAELCQVLNEQHDISPAKLYNKSDGSILAEWRDDVSMSGSGPPFATAFYNARLLITTDQQQLVKTRRTLHLGLCLPYSCSREQVGALLGAVRSPALRHAVMAVRSPQHGGYTYIADPTFQVLLGVCCLVGALLVSATVYDMRLGRAVRRRRHAANMAADTSHTDHKLDINTLDAITHVGGKSMYNVNNNIAISTNTSEERLTAETASQDGHIKLSIWSELLLSFSMKANVLQIFDQSVGADTVPVVHGLRSLSMVWVIFGHTCIVVFKYADNTALRAILEKSFWFQLIISAVYSVDTFFCLGGMLVSFLYFRTSAKGKLDLLTKGRRTLTSGVIQFFGLIGYRFARLTAPYLFMLGVVEVTMKWFAHNAVFEPPAPDHETCPQFWWRNLLYINTLFPVEQMCMLWSWYLSDDTQFYAVSAILLILATSHFKLSVGLTGVFFLSSLVTTGYVSWSSEHVPSTEDPFTQFDKIYDKPWTRLGPYLVGMATGWILFKTNLKIRMNRIWAYVGWAVCTATLLFLIFGLYRAELSVGAAAVYSALSHSLWAACIGWIIIACSTGHTIADFFVELFKFVLFLGLTVLSYFFAFVISVAFEAPMVTMLKILAPQKKPHRV